MGHDHSKPVKAFVGVLALASATSAFVAPGAAGRGLTQQHQRSCTTVVFGQGKYDGKLWDDAAKDDVKSMYDPSQPWSDTNFDPYVKVSERQINPASCSSCCAAGGVSKMREILLRYIPSLCRPRETYAWRLCSSGGCHCCPTRWRFCCLVQDCTHCCAPCLIRACACCTEKRMWLSFPTYVAVGRRMHTKNIAVEPAEAPPMCSYRSKECKRC